MSRKTASFLRCQVRLGMFSDERVVIVKQADGETESFFVPESAVNESGSVVCVEIRRKSAGPVPTIVASLPTCEGKAYVTVRPDDIEKESQFHGQTRPGGDVSARRGKKKA